MCWGHSGGPDNLGRTFLELKVPSPESDSPESLRLGVGLGVGDVEIETDLNTREDYLEEGSSETVGSEN